MKDGIKKGKPNQPVAYNSIFGWVLSGVMKATRIVRTHHATCKLEDLVQRFWEIEQIPGPQVFTPLEAQAEEHFIKTHSRQPNGRYVVRLPFNEKVDSIGESRELALQRLLQLERRFKKNPTYQQQYIEFMKEYLDMGHMEPVTDSTTRKYYIPHHFVRKEDSSTTKLRVVFDASMKSNSGVSLNDALLVGPTIQDELFTQLIRFRTHRVALKADIAKMYRQFEVHEMDRDFQTILWRESSDQPIKEYRLKTVTYGTSCAPFLATRCLQQLATDEQHNFPNASHIMKKMMYVDDFLGGQESVSESLDLFNEMNKLCAAGQLEIRKWCSSESEVLRNIPTDMQENDMSQEFAEDSMVKALGIRWNPSEDSFFFHVEKKEPKKSVTKREVLSEIAKTFDPIGWITPTTVMAKMLFQDLWKETQDWDQQVSEEIRDSWNTYCSQLVEIKKIRIPRCLIPGPTANYQLHCYSDSSEKAMACCLYLRCVSESGEITSNLITSKSKIAPIKQISIPRLELNAAVLLAETVEAVMKCFNFQFTIYAWTDSMITLCWLTSSSRRWKSYVATRVAAITDIIPARCWHHVRSADNPADLPSRGILPEELRDNSLWWNGPSWLSTNEFPTGPGIQTDEDEVSKEERNNVATMLIAAQSDPLSSIFKHSSLSSVVSTVGWLVRFCQFTRNKQSCLKGPLTPGERRKSLSLIIRNVQQLKFKDEVRQLSRKRPLNSNSKLQQFDVFLDSESIIRVGSRIENAKLSFNRKHPIVLPHDHELTTLIIRQQHADTLHGGFTLTLAMLRRSYWIIRGRDIVRHVVRKCVTCKRVKATTSQQMMGNLPSARVTAHRPFLHCGVDFAGSFQVKMRKGRGSALDKCYMAVFVCFSTKAVHLEVVTSLSTPEFLAAFRRFTSRRGIPSHMYSDCGTNFIGADKELKKMLEASAPEIQQQTSVDGITWIFNPPAAPHQGGLWEAAVKSAKYHIKRVIGNQVLSLEQFQTLLCNVEACLNSRPLCALSADPLDVDALTPGHFLVGQPLLAVPEGDLTSIPENRLDYWQKVQQMTQHFWRRWREEYLVTLQQRPKWNVKQRNMEIGDLVVVREDNLPPAKWKLGRVIATHPGPDKLVRKATVKTSTGEFIRPIIKLSILLHNNEC